ncbi:MAG: hypothetical protein AAGA76_12795 [Pseudomonadota bacterium]
MIGTATPTGDIQHFGIGLNWFPSAAPGFHIKSSFYIGEIENAVTPLSVVTGTPNSFGVEADYDGYEITLRRDF